MGYTDGHPCFLDLNMPQTPRNIHIVRDLAGFTWKEMAEAMNLAGGMEDMNGIGISESDIFFAENGEKPLAVWQWKAMIDVCGRRAFDHDGDAL